MSDQVNHPKHYTAHASGVECITVVEHMSFNLGNVVKYIWRADEKDAPIQDLEKAAWYLNREIARRHAADTPTATEEASETVDPGQGGTLPTITDEPRYGFVKDRDGDVWSKADGANAWLRCHRETGRPVPASATTWAAIRQYGPLVFIGRTLPAWMLPA